MSCNISWCGFLSILEEKKSQPLFSRIFRGIWWKTSTGIESFTNVGVGHRQPQIQNQNQNQHQDFKTKWRRLQVLTVKLLNNQVFFALTPVTSHASHLSVAIQSIQIIKEMVFCHYKFHPTYEIFCMKLYRLSMIFCFLLIFLFFPLILKRNLRQNLKKEESENDIILNMTENLNFTPSVVTIA